MENISYLFQLKNFIELILIWIINLPILEKVQKIDLVTVFDAILTSKQTREKLQWLYESLMSNNSRRTAVLKKYDL